MKLKSKLKILMWTGTMAGLLALTGCGLPKPELETQILQAGKEGGKSTASPLKNEAPVYPQPIDGMAGNVKPSAGNTAGNTVTSTATSSPDTSGTGVEAYTTKKPMLMGIQLSDSMDKVVRKFGKPSSEYTLDDDRDPITIYEYPGFLVSFNKVHSVVCVEIVSQELQSGLNGLKPGQKVKDAEKALGRPDTHTHYALSYKASGTVLKLDLDPKTGTIQSIKLFADSI